MPLPIIPFDGQEFIDFFRVKWVYSSENKCWVRKGSVPDVPAASETQSGLLSAQLKQLIDGVPEAGGHFGIIANPLLSVVPTSHKPILKGKVGATLINESGSQITVSEADATIEVNKLAGKLLYFISGILKGRQYLIFTNSADIIFVQGVDAAQSSIGDRFEILEPYALNKDGIMLGNIKLSSDTLDISCVKGDGTPIEDENCTLDYIVADDPDNPPGLDIKVSKNFLDAFCVQVPGVAGPRGDRGPQGQAGNDGTGDGPQGEAGDAGISVTIASKFSGIKINDISDIYDTAIVALELDASNGKLHVVKAKIDTPSGDTAAQKLITTPLDRSIEFTDDKFAYKLIAPSNDPINDSDVDVAHYPQGFQGEQSKSTQINITNLSKIVDDVINVFKNKLTKTEQQYNKQLKEYIQNKDKEARLILSKMADSVAQCEFSLPISFCLGLQPNMCAPLAPNETVPFPLAESLFGPDFKNAIAQSIGPQKFLPEDQSRPGGGGGGGGGQGPQEPGKKTPPPGNVPTVPSDTQEYYMTHQEGFPELDPNVIDPANIPPPGWWEGFNFGAPQRTRKPASGSDGTSDTVYSDNQSASETPVDTNSSGASGDSGGGE